VPPLAAAVDLQRSDGLVGTVLSPNDVGGTVVCSPPGIIAAAAGMHGVKGLVETCTKSGYIGKEGRHPPKPSGVAAKTPDVCGASGLPQVVAARPPTRHLFR